jgi:hypothetical protein
MTPPLARAQGARVCLHPRSEVEQRNLIGSLHWNWAIIVGDW